ncbi:cyclic nucleotide-binding domain protein [Leptospira ryugenii]|uniref:Cyclic nucleotide-binding domain protein n=1 Tax=Leptospira ryugenii TaxID=1917863 RepID=A0A2P2E0E9_9LEPT|nr:Crp/Fnr family transcriptional regulator [Leptospira ryugenii]GBF50349.1 cyclic nucleotide-binding domain protein [Leptospira ryugenii]
MASKRIPLQTEDLTFLYQSLSSILPIPKSIWEEMPEDFFTMRFLEKGEFFLKEGKVASEMAIVKDGLVMESYLTKKGDEFVKTYNFPGELTGSYYDLLSGVGSTCSIRALKDSRFAVAPFQKLLQLRESSHFWAKWNLRLVELLFQKKAKREFELLTMSAEERYQSLKRERPNIESELSQQQIASFLRITPVTLSRIKNQAY